MRLNRNQVQGSFKAGVNLKLNWAKILMQQRQNSRRKK
jgi:hypothetical protein